MQDHFGALFSTSRAKLMLNEKKLLNFLSLSISVFTHFNHDNNSKQAGTELSQMNEVNILHHQTDLNFIPVLMCLMIFVVMSVMYFSDSFG